MNGMTYLYLFLAGGVGVSARFFSVKVVSGIFGVAFPYGTLVVNVIGSLLFGFLSWYILQRWSANLNVDALRVIVLTGLLGGYTTFSAFSMEMLQFFQSGQMMKALSYMMASVLICVFACFAGLVLAKQIV